MLDQRGSGPRTYRNALVFLAPDRQRLQELEQAVRQYLAWKSIDEEHETLNPDQTPLQAVRRAATITEEGAVSFLRKYLFAYRQSSQRIGLLSGGACGG